MQTESLTMRAEDIEDNVCWLGTRRFRHRYVQADDVRLHLVDGGAGPAVIFLAGFPQSWYAWRRVLPLMADSHRVIAVDLPGQGDSETPLDGFDTARAGERIAALARVLGLQRYALVGHDIGAWIAYPYATRHADVLDKVVLIDANIPGVTLPASITLGPDNWRSWHFLFNSVPDLPEALLHGRERVLIEWFFRRKTANRAAVFSEADIDEYARVYRQPGGLRGMLGYYRAVEEDRRQNQALSSTATNVPILAIAGAQGSAPDLPAALKPLVANLSCATIAECGHYIPEEKPLALVEQLRAFL